MPGYIEDRLRRINIKSKRRRNLLKKAIELKRMCDMKMFFVMHDAEFNKTYVYKTCSDTFSHEYLKDIAGQGS